MCTSCPSALISADQHRQGQGLILTCASILYGTDNHPLTLLVILQAAIEPLVQELVASDSTKLSRICERALRMLPRGLYHANVAASDACANVALSVLPGYDTEPPSVDVLILQELKLAPGQHFLEVGSGSGYLTALAAFIVGPNGSAMGVDISADAVAYAREQCTAMLAAGRFGHGVPPPKFRVRDGGTLLEIGEMWDAIVVCGDVPAPWIKTLCRLLTPCGQMVACVDGRLCCFHPSASGNDGVPIGEYGFEPMTLSRRTRRVAPAVPGRVGDGNTPNTTNVTSGRGSRVPTPTVAAVKGRQGGSGGLQPRIIGGDALTAADARDKSWGEDDIHMEQVMREIEKEQMNGLLVMADDIEVCRTPKGRKCRLGEGGFGVVYKALMNGVDEVAVKLVKVWAVSCAACHAAFCKIHLGMHQYGIKDSAYLDRLNRTVRWPCFLHTV